MKILHINFTDKGGGAAIAAYRHHEAMCRSDIDSKMIVQTKFSDDSNVVAHKIKPIVYFLKRVFGKVFQILNPYYATWSWNKYGFDFSQDKEVQEADIIILHWINSYTLSLKSIEKILKTGKPVYWFMHDMWPITGGCHHALDCSKYTTHCHACPMTNNRRGTSKKKDLSWKQFEEKLRRLSPYRNLHFLAPSKWLADKVKLSSLFGDHKVEVVRNVLDTHIFIPRNKSDARKRLGLPGDKKLILFGADNLNSPYKGWNLLKKALRQPIDGAEVVVYGIIPSDIQSEIGLKIHAMGHLNNTDELVDLYSACDVFVTPSLADNYPNVLIEALSCGLPCIGTDVGGIPEIIQYDFQGRIVGSSPYEIQLAIEEVLKTEEITNREKRHISIEEANSYKYGLISFLNEKIKI